MCVMSVLGVKPREMGDGIILSRLEKGSDPVTVHIPTSQQQVRAINYTIARWIFFFIFLPLDKPLSKKIQTKIQVEW